MKYKKLEYILLCILIAISAGVYLYTVAPTLSLWDCGEFIASAYTLAVPHPPGTPLYIILGRTWLLVFGIVSAILPISKEVAWHMNLLGLTFSVITIVLLYKMLLKIFRMHQKGNNELRLIIIAFATCLGIGFFYTFWQNAVETEVYAAATFVFVLVNYLTILWYESVKKGSPKNKYLLLIFYIIFLSSGIHLTPFLIFIPVYTFIFIVERRYLKDLLLLLLGVFQIAFFALTFLLPAAFFKPTLVLLGLILLLAIILVLKNPVKYTNWRFFWAGIFLIIMGISTELYLPIRSSKLTELYKDKETIKKYLARENIAPRINECNPGEDFSVGAMFDYDSAYNSVLHRGQYGPQRLIPRKTQDTTGFNLIQGSFWQFAHFVRYLSWQPAPEGTNKVFRSAVLAFFYLFGLWGMVEMYKREKKIFLLTILIMFMLSLAIVGYLNLKFSPSDSDPEHQPREVRERDYFFHTSHVYFGILIGFGFLGFADFLKKQTRNKKLIIIGGLSGILVFSTIPLFANIHVNNRHGVFTPKDYGYNLLASCDDGAILFTNGDNDTFPLWFAQEVLGIKRNVIIANLSLINTDWYIKQLKYWGVPIVFTDRQIETCDWWPRMRSDRKIIYVKDIMIRHIIATNAGIKLNNEDYFLLTQKEFASRYLKGYKGKLPIYFSSTVSPENFEGFAPYLKLEGLVYRLTGDSVDVISNVNIEKTQDLFYRTYRYTGLFVPEKQNLLSKILVDFEKRRKEGEFYASALQLDETTKRLYQNYATGLFSFGLALEKSGNYQAAINAWQFALAFEQERVIHHLHYNLGLLYAQLGVVDSAEYYFSLIDVKDPHIIVRIGSIYGAMEMYDKAIEYFRKGLNINPQLPEAYFGLYSLYLKKNDSVSAIRILNEWLKLNPRDTSAINMLKELKRK